MKIVISVHGKFHATHLAEYFEGRGMLEQFITTYPVKHIAKKYNILPKHITSLPLKLLLEVGLKRIIGFHINEFLLNNLFDRQASKKIKLNGDIYFLWSGCSLQTIQKIKRANASALIVLVRGSAHIEVQQSLLAKIDQNIVIDKRLIQKEKEEYALADYVTVPSSFAKKTFLQKGFLTEKIFFNPLGVNLNHFSYKEKKHDPNIKKLKVGYSGNLSAQKNVAGIIASVQTLISNGYLIELHLAGKIDVKSFNKNLLDSEWIKYYGKLKENELEHFYHNIDVYILNSVQDGFAVVLLQAMATGLPVIATTNSGGPDLITEFKNGFIIPILNNVALSQKILWFYNNRSSIPEMSYQSFLIAKQGFTWDDFGIRHNSLLGSISNGE